MDPMTNIEEQLKIANRIIKLDSVGSTDAPDHEVVDEQLGNAVRLAELVEALDEWRKKGGFDPYTERRPAWEGLDKWVVAYLRDARDSEAIDRDVPDAIIEREAENLRKLIYQTAGSFVDNEFDDSPEVAS